jgi:hypothetical protein
MTSGLISAQIRSLVSRHLAPRLRYPP